MLMRYDPSCIGILCAECSLMMCEFHVCFLHLPVHHQQVVYDQKELYKGVLNDCPSGSTRLLRIIQERRITLVAQPRNVRVVCVRMSRRVRS